MNIYLAVILAILLIDYFLNVVVDLLNIRALSTVLPGEFADIYDPEKYRRSQEYLKENTRFGLVSGTVFTAARIAFILAGGFNLVDLFARNFALGPLWTGLIFAGALALLQQLLGIPFSAYRIFVIEQKFGFNRTTPGTFAADILKSWVLGALIGGAVFAAILWLFRAWGPSAWLYCWLLVTTAYLFLTFIAPVVIMPLFNKFVPLKEGELKNAIESYARSQDFKMKGLFTMDSSKRSTKSNAFFTGFGRFRRIVLFDTLIERHTVDELVSVLAHEMGHYKKGHIRKGITLSVLTTGLMFFILSFFIGNSGLSEAFRMQHLSVYSGIVFFGFLYAPISLLISIFENILSRRYEYEADAYAVGTYGKPEAMIDALKKLSVDNFSNLAPHPLKVFLEYTHPPVLKRINAIRRRKAD